MKKLLLLIIVSFTVQHAAAEDKNFYNLGKSNTHDTTHIKSFFKYLNIENNIGRNGLNVLVSEIGGNKIRYSINHKMQLGYKFNWRFISFSFGINIPVISNSELKFGKSTGFNLNFVTQIKRKVLLDIYFLSQKSLYVHNANNLIDDYDSNDIRPIFEDMQINHLGIDAGYLFNNKHFTFKAPLNINERQLKSAGSFTIGGYFFYSQIKNNNGLLNDTLEVKFNEFRNAIDMNSINLGVSAGYGHNFVIKKHGLISTTGHLGFGPGFSKIEYENGIVKNKVMLSGRYKFRFVGAYMNDNISAGVRALIGLLPNSTNNNIRIYYETDQIALFFSYRFLPEMTKRRTIKKGN